jgi:putative ABC transport system permease protein
VKRPLLAWLPRGPRRIRQDLDEELAFHLEQRAAELERQGWSPAAARDEARRRFGDLEQTREMCYRTDLRRERHEERREYLSELQLDLRHAARQLRRGPGFAAAAILTLAFGIGSTTAIWSIADHVALRPLPYEQPDRVMTLWQSDPRSQGAKRAVAPGNFVEWQERSRSFSFLGIADPSGFDLTEDRPPEPLTAWRISSGFLEALGARPVLGRGFAEEDYLTGAPKVVLLSHALWRDHFAADPAIVGRAIQLDFEPVVVIGVMPPWLEYPEPRHLWAPLRRFSSGEVAQRGAGWMSVVGRLRPGVTMAQAQAELDAVAAAITRDRLGTGAPVGIKLVALEEQILGEARPVLLVLFGAVVLLLLIACANVANLLLARGAERAGELSVRAALGAGRGRLVRQLVTESTLLAAVGAAAGLAVARAALVTIFALGPPELPRLSQANLDGRVLAFAGVMTLLTAVLAGLAPALHLAGSRPLSFLRGTGRGITGDRARTRLHGALVVSEIAISLVLLIGAGLLMRSFLELRANDIGFRVERRAELQTFLWDRNPTAEQRRQRVASIVERMASLPGIESIGVVSALPFHPSQIAAQGTLVIEGRPPLPAGESQQVFTTVASPAYFDVMEIPLVAGRSFTARDRADAPAVALINETLARLYFPTEDPVGERVTIGVMSAPVSREIVGVVADVRPLDLASEPRAELYVPYEQSSTGSVTFVASTSGNPAHLVQPMREAVWSVDPDQTIYHASTIEGLVAETLAERRFNLLLLAAFSLAALALATLGMYGVVAYATGQRVQEIGVRVAMGARPRDIRRIFLLHGLTLGLPGVLLGVGGALLLTRFLASMLYGVRPIEPLVFFESAAVLLAVTLAGAYFPARRAARVDPALALRRSG